MKEKTNGKKTAAVIVGAILTAALYTYSIYSAYYTFKRGKMSEIILYTALLSVCVGIVMLLYTVTDKKRTHTAANKVVVPVVSAVVHAAAYLSVGFGIQKIISPGPAGKAAAGVSLVLSGIAAAIFLNGLSFSQKKAQRVAVKVTAVLCSLAVIITGVSFTAGALSTQSYLKWFYESSKESENIGGKPTSDGDIVYDFAYATEKDVRNTPLGTDESIDIKLAKNEWEGFQVIFASAVKGKKVSVSVTDFKNSDGDTLKTEAFKADYTEVKGMGNKYNCEYADALIPVSHTGDRGCPAELKKGLQQSFFIRTRAEKDAKAGEYTARVTAVNEKNEVILEKEIKAVVWNFTLPDTPANDTAFGNYGENFWALSGVQSGDTAASQRLTEQVYDMLLENRLSPYNLPYDVLDERADAYMSDPRLTSFRVPFPDDDELLVKYYNKLKTNPDWLKKAYFYPVDEPQNAEAYAKYDAAVERRNRLAPEVGIVTPFNTDIVNINGEKMSSVQLQAGKSSILCGLSEVVNRGTTHEEMMAEVKNGSRAWWYVCCAPTGDYCNFLDYQDAIRHRILMWQQKSLDLTGLLYWSVLWCQNNPWEVANNWGNYDGSGDGLLIYPGGYIGMDEPVPTIRLYNIADGMEDYDYFALAEAKYGRAWVDEKIAKVTSSPTRFITDHAQFEQIRREIGDALTA